LQALYYLKDHSKTDKLWYQKNKQHIVTMKRIILSTTFLIYVLAFPASAQNLQEAPSLQLGLGKISLSKGNFDADLLAQIIAEKQDEIQVKLVKDMLLRRAGLDNGLFYTYIDETINILTQERDPDIRTRNLTENTVNLSFVVAYAEYYLNTMTSYTNQRYQHFFLASPLSSNFNTASPPESVAYQNAQSVLGAIDTSRMIKLSAFSKLNYTEVVQDSEGELKVEYLSLFIDVVAEAVRQNEKLRELGLMRTHYLQNYSSANAYLSLERRMELEEDEEKKAELQIQKVWADSVFSDVSYHLEKHLEYFGLIKAMANRGNNWRTIYSQFEGSSDCSIQVPQLRAILKEGLEAIADLEKLSEDELQALDQIAGLLDKLRYVEANRYNYIALYESEIRPSLARLAKYNVAFLELAESLEAYLFCIGKEIEQELEAIGLDIDLPFINLLAVLDEFDQPETYTHYLNLLSDAGDIFGDDKQRATINLIIGMVRGFLKLSEEGLDGLQLNLDVQGLLVTLQELPYDRPRPLQFHFTLGGNYGSFLNEDFSIQNNEDTLELANYSYLSEKIGLKIKLYDFDYTQGQPRGSVFRYYGKSHKQMQPPREPTISNWHAIVFGSGLLYNIINTSSEPAFNYPILGIGTGLTFFNQLDLNISYCRPVQSGTRFLSSDNPGFLNIGFDIQFIEYLDRLNEKRAARRYQKRLAEAQK